MDRMAAVLATLVQGAGALWQAASEQGQAEALPKNSGGHWDIAFSERYLPREVHQAIHPLLGSSGGILERAEQLTLAKLPQRPATKTSALEAILAGHDRQNQPNSYIALRPRELQHEAIFPSSGLPDPTQTREGYRSLWAQFSRECNDRRWSEDLLTCTEQLQGLFQHYAWCVPCHPHQADVSLYDHYRTRAALAACIADLAESTSLAVLDNPEAPLACLIEGDISGVQRFIYTITSKGAARGLRGRSFYLQLLTEGVSRYVLRQLDLPATNLIYVGGGHFYLLGPASAVEALPGIRQKLDNLLLKYHDGALYLAVGHALLSARDFTEGRFAEKWIEVGQSTSRAKRRRFGDLPSSVLDEAVFSPRGHGGNEEQECQVCHSEHLDVKSETFEETDEAVRKCRLCTSLEELGRLLGQSDLILLADVEPQQTPNQNWEALLLELGLTVGLKNSREWNKPPSRKIQRGMLLGMSSLPDGGEVNLITQELGAALSAWFRPTINVTPMASRHRVATFSDLQDVAQGLKRLGILRMDVDDLGQLFASKLKDSQHASLAHAAAMSSALALFFEGWVGVLCKRLSKPREAGEDTLIEPLYTVYSGGDDLFIVGAWDVLPELAQQIAEDLTRYTHGKVHASAGITLHAGKYPLYQAATEAHDALEAAKDVPGKNAITFLDQSVSWTEWPEVVGLKDRLVSLINDLSVGRALLHTLGRLHADYQSQKATLNQKGEGFTRNGQSQVVWGPWMWRGTYLLSRHETRAPEDARTELKALRERLADNNFTTIKYVGLAARWAEALTKAKAKGELRHGL